METTTTFYTNELEFRYGCVHCGHLQQAMVTATGVGSSSSLNQEGTGVARAGENALEMGEQTLAFVPCPNCGKRNEEQAKGIVIKTLLMTIGLPALICYGAIGGWLFLEDEDMVADPTAWLVLTGLFLFVGGLTFLLTPKPWRRAVERTRFADPSHDT